MRLNNPDIWITLISTGTDDSGHFLFPDSQITRKVSSPNVIGRIVEQIEDITDCLGSYKTALVLTQSKDYVPLETSQSPPGTATPISEFSDFALETSNPAHPKSDVADADAGQADISESRLVILR